MKTLLLSLIALFCAVFPHAGPLRQSDTAILFTASPASVKPGEMVTLTWKIPDSFRNLDHVTIEMSHPVLTTTPVIFNAPDRTGTLIVTIPPDYYDLATFRLYPKQAGDQRYTDAEGQSVWAETEVVVDDGVAVTKLRADPNPTDRGNGVLISWEVSGLDPDTASVYFWYYGEDGIFVQTNSFPLVGTMVLEPPPYYTENFSVFLHAEKVWSGNRLDIAIRCPFAEFLGPQCPFTHEEITLRYQPFEHGWLMTRGGNVFVVREDGYFYEWVPQADDPTSTDLIPPEGLQVPVPELTGVWSKHNLVDSLGWAVADESTYTTLFETVPDTAGRHRVTGYYFYLPSGELIHANPMIMFWWPG